MIPKDTPILIVDDMSTMRRIMANALRDLGFHQITEAVDGEDAWKQIQGAHKAKKRFEIVISDWNMPKLKGLDLLEKIRANPSVAGTVFVMLTAESQREQIAHALQAGVSGYILKPFTKEQLMATMNAAFQKRPKVA